MAHLHHSEILDPGVWHTACLSSGGWRLSGRGPYLPQAAVLTCIFFSGQWGSKKNPLLLRYFVAEGKRLLTAFAVSSGVLRFSICVYVHYRPIRWNVSAKYLFMVQDGQTKPLGSHHWKGLWGNFKRGCTQSQSLVCSFCATVETWRFNMTALEEEDPRPL